MDRTEATPEDLPPLELRKLRDLDVARDDDDERDPYIYAASAVVRRGDFTYVIGDDELDLAIFRLSAGEPGELRQVLAGDLSDDEDERKRRKPDLEALTAMPPFERAPYGGLLGLGSGSKRSRDRGFFWKLAADGSLDGEPRQIDLQPLYEALRGEIEELNIEGAAVLGGRFALFHRGNAAESENAVAELSLERVLDSLTGDQDLDPHELERIAAYDLGELDGVRLSFSDATALTEDLVVFTASAEGGGSGSDDGKIHGSVVGTLDPNGTIRRLRTIDRRWKVEGVHAALDAGVIDFAFVCDQDSEDEPSPLLSATMPAAEGLE
ncbi:MAG: hypothetical protein K0R88_697 [Solirubrobacterales bacterium]|jgi:hypothetical protein|nr:hypothetical protein [Solirubrobacterales bacterium]